MHKMIQVRVAAIRQCRTTGETDFAARLSRDDRKER
jgi:hypothetical protein